MLLDVLRLWRRRREDKGKQKLGLCTTTTSITITSQPQARVAALSYLETFGQEQKKFEFLSEIRRVIAIVKINWPSGGAGVRR